MTIGYPGRKVDRNLQDVRISYKNVVVVEEDARL
jgi:hypothetical protein